MNLPPENSGCGKIRFTMKEKDMNFWIKPLLIATVVSVGAHLAVFSSVAAAHDEGHGGKHAGQPREDIETRLARLESALALTPEQKPAWEEFRRALKERSERMAAREKTREKGEGRGEGQGERREKTGEPPAADARQGIEAFYAGLKSEQKAVFDAEFGNSFRARRDGSGEGRSGKERRPGASE
jgi:hypothetical protein